jgi:UDP-3-O-[3-hydroxymyristoyl] N-acetylglucosamine deacetylase
VSARQVVLTGRGLHTGEDARVTVRRGDAAIDTTLNGSPLSEWRPVPALRSTAIARADVQVRTVEHLFAALAGLRWRRGVAIELEGNEAPILDGCAATWTTALRALDVAPSGPRIRVLRRERIEVEASLYELSPGDHPHVSVELELDDPRVARDASWDGDPLDFASRVATARTFCLASEVDALARLGLASHVTPEMVVVLGDEILAAGRPFEPDEPARHKLLDLVGDLFLHGGPPLGHVHARRPGHWATHEALRIATERGALAPA